MANGWVRKWFYVASISCSRGRVLSGVHSITKPGASCGLVEIMLLLSYLSMQTSVLLGYLRAIVCG